MASDGLILNFFFGGGGIGKVRNFTGGRGLPSPGSPLGTTPVNILNCTLFIIKRLFSLSGRNFRHSKLMFVT